MLWVKPTSIPSLGWVRYHNYFLRGSNLVISLRILSPGGWLRLEPNSMSILSSFWILKRSSLIVRAGDLMQDLKTGHLCHASPRAQFYGQLIGSSVSILVTTTAYILYNRAYTIPGPSFPAPTAYVWLSLARLLRNYLMPEFPQIKV